MNEWMEKREWIPSREYAECVAGIARRNRSGELIVRMESVGRMGGVRRGLGGGEDGVSGW